MNRLSAITLAALFAGLSAGTMAAESSSGKTDDATQSSQGSVQSTQSQDASPQAAPAGQSAQSQDSGSQASSGASSSGTGDTGGTRDWAKVDSNSDGVIQPEEMESFLSQGQKQ